MRKINKLICLATLLLFTASLTSTVLAQGQYRYSDSYMRDLLNRLDSHSNAFGRSLEDAVSRNGYRDNTRQDEAARLIRDFEDASSQLMTRFDQQRASAVDTRIVLDRAGQINRFLIANNLGSNVQRDWDMVRSDLDQLARAFSINWQWNNTSINSTAGRYGSDYRLNDAQARQLAQRIAVRASRFNLTLRQAINRGDITDRTTADDVRRHLADFESAAAALRDRANRAQVTTTDVRNLLDSAAYLNNFMANNRLGYGVTNEWNLLKQDLDQLATASNITWNSERSSSDDGYQGSGYTADGRITGTYRLNSAQGDNPQVVADSATRNLPYAQRQRIHDSLIRRLDPPDTLAIERQGSTVTIASSRAPQVNLIADGTEHVETTQNGRTIRVRATLAGDQLTIQRTGERAQDFSVTFEPTDNGRRLIVTRRIYLDELNQPVTVRSYYDKTSDVAQLDLYNASPDNSNVGSSGSFIVPNGSQLVAVLNTDLSTQTVRDNDRFTMTVRSPDEYSGATIEGYVTNVNRSGRVSGRSELTLNFDNIRLSDGRTYRFAGILENVRTANGDTVRVDNEGAVREGDSQTSRTVQRAAIGTAVGAIIGAIAGGGKGAAIGAVIGAGAGAGSVYVQGRDDLDLPSGTEITIRATGPSAR